MNVYSVQQRTGYFVLVSFQHGFTASALTGGMSLVSAGAWIHCCNEHHVGGICHGACCSRDSYHSVLKRLTERFFSSPVEFGKFVQKQNSVVCQTDFARTGDSTAACQSLRRHGVVRMSERSSRYELNILRQFACHRIYFCGFYFFLKSHLGQNRTYSFRQHGLPCAGRANHQYIVTSCRSDFQSVLCLCLSTHITIVQLFVPHLVIFYFT